MELESLIIGLLLGLFLPIVWPKLPKLFSFFKKKTEEVIT